MGLRLFFLPNFPGAMFIQGATFIPDSRVSGGKYQLLFLGQNWQKLNVLDMSIEGRISIQINCV